MERLKGIGVSSGVAVGPALVAIQRTQVIRFPIAARRITRELAALDRARARSEEQLRQIRAHVAALRGADLAAIFDAQILMLDDPMVVARATALVREERVNAEWAVQRAVDELASVFNEVAEALSLARRRLEALSRDPVKHARHAIKVLMKFKLLEVQAASIDEWQAWVRSTPYLAVIRARFFASWSLDELGAEVLAELVKAGAAFADEVQVRNE